MHIQGKDLLQKVSSRRKPIAQSIASFYLVNQRPGMLAVPVISYSAQEMAYTEREFLFYGDDN